MVRILAMDTVSVLKLHTNLNHALFPRQFMCFIAQEVTFIKPYLTGYLTVQVHLVGHKQYAVLCFLNT